MKSAAVLMLVAIVALVLFLKCGQTGGPAEEQPQTSPPQQAEPKADKPVFTKDYEAAMQEKDGKVIVVFGAEWCPHCVVLKDHLKSMNLQGYTVCFVDVDEHKELKRKYGVRSLPTSIIFYQGKETSREKGFDKARYEAWVEENR